MWNHAFAAILNAFLRIPEIPAAFAAKGIQRAVTEQAVEVFRSARIMAREKLAFLMLKKREPAFLRF